MIKRYCRKIPFIIGLLLIFGGFSMQYYANEASFLLHHPVNLRFLSYLNDKNLFDLKITSRLIVGDRWFKFNQPQSDVLQAACLIWKPSKEDFRIHQQAAADTGAAGGGEACIEVSGYLILFSPVTDETREIFRSFPALTYPINQSVFRRSVFSLASNPTGVFTPHSSAHLLFDVCAEIFKAAIICAMMPFRLLAAALIILDSSLGGFLRSYIILLIGTTIVILTYKPAFPPPGKNSGKDG
ncbi:MAG: hypothetical protein ACOX8W_06250 [bacterium]|jgi:hypothetical protein